MPEGQAGMYTHTRERRGRAAPVCCAGEEVAKQMRRRLDFSTPADVFFDPVVQLAALCPISALAALRPEAAIAALAPGLVLFNPAINPVAAVVAFVADPLYSRPAPPFRPRGGPAVRHGGRDDVVLRPYGTDGVAVRSDGADGLTVSPAGTGGAVVRPGGPDGVVVRPAGTGSAVVRPGGPDGVVVRSGGPDGVVARPDGTGGGAVRAGKGRWVFGDKRRA